MFRTLTAAVVVLGAAAALTALGCGDDGASPANVTTVVVLPDSTPVLAGNTAQFTATAFDGSGQTVSGVNFTWTSLDQDVATVDANGLATAHVMGSTEIRASTSGVSGSGKIVVVPNGNADPPDDAFSDSNGDGIDGDIAQAVFVSPTGSDANPGTIDQPKQTLAGAIAAAVADVAKSEVYVAAGTYTETVQLADGISIYGGYDAASNWQRAPGNAAIVDGDTAAVVAQSLGRRTVVDLVTIRSADNTVAGGNSTGIYVADSDSLILRNLTVNAGNGAPGAGGTVGVTGGSGTSGAAGIVPAGGAGGSSPVANDGGAGGNGSTGAPLGDNGLAGLGPSGGPGGAGGSDGLVCPGSGFDGGDGDAGGAGTPGVAGAGGDGVGAVVGGYWVGSAGAAGTKGTDGSGGGGGGGGGVGPVCGPPPGAGGGGGGGGGGAEGGAPGTGGSGAGGSFGVFAYDSEVVIEASDITAGGGGVGGMGGGGGAGGVGGAGGTGAVGAPDGSGGVGGTGGDGGLGGDGGVGGPGGGGGGGISYAVYAAGSFSVQIDVASVLTAGAGGAGGAQVAGGNPGTQGVSGDKNF